MPLTQSDRISISKKLVDIPKENAIALDNKAKLNDAQVKAQQVDTANKSLMDIKTALINGYQSELQSIDGNGRTQLLEQDITDSALNKLGNYFSPNNTASVPPSIPGGTWKFFVPFSGSKGIGKSYLETFTAVTNETALIASINADITTMNTTYTAIQISTGQSCLADVISANAALQALATNIINNVQTWLTLLQATQPLIVTTDPNATLQAQNNTAISNITTIEGIITTWQALPTFDPSTGQTTCVGFNGYNPNLLLKTKFRTDGLSPLTTGISNRSTYLTTRASQLGTNLGGVVQNMTNGSITSFSGLYGDRFNIINLRLNLMNGSARKVQSLALGQTAQDEGITSNNSAQSVYASVMVVSAFKAPALGNNNIHVNSPTGFIVGDTVYIVSETQPEIQTTISSISGNMIGLQAVIPVTYRQNESARIYKVL